MLPEPERLHRHALQQVSEGGCRDLDAAEVKAVRLGEDGVEVVFLIYSGQIGQTDKNRLAVEIRDPMLVGSRQVRVENLMVRDGGDGTRRAVKVQVTAIGALVHADERAEHSALPLIPPC